MSMLSLEEGDLFRLLYCSSVIAKIRIVFEGPIWDPRRQNGSPNAPQYCILSRYIPVKGVGR
jgi:hypothetical protein